jgi:tRNA-dihydrouridine synthase
LKLLKELSKLAFDVQDVCDAVEINIGCPQRHARLGLFGAYLLAREHWPKVIAMVNCCTSSVNAFNSNSAFHLIANLHLFHLLYVPAQ